MLTTHNTVFSGQSLPIRKTLNTKKPKYPLHCTSFFLHLVGGSGPEVARVRKPWGWVQYSSRPTDSQCPQRGIPGRYSDKKENRIFLIYREIQSGAVAKSYMRKGFLIYGEMREHFPKISSGMCQCFETGSVFIWSGKSARKEKSKNDELPCLELRRALRRAGGFFWSLNVLKRGQRKNKKPF